MTITETTYLCGKHIWVDDDVRTVTVEHGHEVLKLNMIQWTKEHLSLRNPYFKVELLEDIVSTQICMIGTNPKIDVTVPCWDLYKSCRYNSNDGGVYTEGKGQKTFRTYGHKGDTILVHLEDVTPDKCLLDFFLNKKLVYRQWVFVEPENLHPAIGISNGPAKFRVTWPGMGKQFDIDHTLVSNWLGHPAITKSDHSNSVECKEHIPGAILSVQAPKPLDKDDSYFEVELLANVNPDACPAIGLTHAGSDRLLSYPGVNHDTVGYHGDGGVYVNDDGTGYSLIPSEDTIMSVGSKMGCGIVFEPGGGSSCQTPQLVIVYFTKNGQIIYNKPRLLPEGGFYPTVTLPEKGDKVTILHPSPPGCCTELHTEIERWRPLYTGFRFSETIEFIDYKEHGLVDTVEIRGNKDVPQILQYVRERKESYYFHFKIISIGYTTEFKIGVAEGTILRQSETLPYDSINKTFTINGTWDEVVRVGDKVEVFIDTVEPGRIWQTVVVRGNIVFKEETYFDSKVTIYPTMCFKNGPIKLQVTWPDMADMKEQTTLCSDSILQWRHGKDIIVNTSQITCTSIPDKTSCCNIVAPVPVNKQGAFYFEIKLITPKGKASPMFPGIGVTSGIIPAQNKTLALLKQASSAFFYGTTQSLVTWKGHMFQVDILDTEALDKNIIGVVPEPVDISELDWKAHADAVVSALPGFEVNSDERFSSIDSVYISHDSADIKQIDKIILGLQRKGYKVQTTSWNLNNKRKLIEMEMSSVVIFCVSPVSVNNKIMLGELRQITAKNLPMLPICLGTVTWPPGGALREGLVTFDKYTGVKLNLQEEIGPGHINTIEHNMSMAVGASLQPALVRPLSSVMFEGTESDLDTTDDDDDDNDDDDDVPSAVAYQLEAGFSSGKVNETKHKRHSNKKTIKSSTCLIL